LPSRHLEAIAANRKTDNRDPVCRFLDGTGVENRKLGEKCLQDGSVLATVTCALKSKILSTNSQMALNFSNLM
jgi:hypothetical protein